MVEPIIQKEYLIESSPRAIRDLYRFGTVTLGEGTYGFVRLAERLSDQTKFAIKIIPKKKIKKPETLAREITVMKQVDHPNIVKLYETFEDARYIYLVMELCEGGELFDRLIEIGHFTEQQAALLFSQMLSAVAYLHSINIAHRDLKPENFLFSTQCEINSLKLIDFGLAKVVTPITQLTSKTGTCYYVSPETLLGGYNEKCDVWSLGVILFMMLAGYPPFDGSTDREIIENVKRSEFSFAEEIWTLVSSQAKELISKMLVTDPALRISSNEALEHPWVVGNEGEPLSPVRLDINQLESYQKSTKFRKAVLNYMAIQCTTHELSYLIRTFHKLDRNHDGTLSIEEIKTVLSSNSAFSNERVEEIVRSIDGARKGKIHLSEFLAATLDRRVYMNQEKLAQAFRRFDVSNIGYITAEELREVLDKDNTINDPLVWEEIISEVDIDGDGKVSFEEFVNMMERVSNEEVNSIKRQMGSN